MCSVSKCCDVSCEMLLHTAKINITFTRSPFHSRLFYLTEKFFFLYFFALLLEHDLVASEHMCHGKLQLHYSCDIKLNFILLSNIVCLFIIFIFRGIRSPLTRFCAVLCYHQRNASEKEKHRRKNCENVNSCWRDENPQVQHARAKFSVHFLC